MKRFLFLYLISMFTFLIARDNSVVMVEVEDANNQSHEFPKEFIEEHTTLRNLAEDFSGKFMLPESISLDQFDKYYKTAQIIENREVFAKNEQPSLQQLMQYAAYSELLENIELRDKILELVHAQLKQLPKDSSDAQAARHLFTRYFQSSKKGMFQSNKNALEVDIAKIAPKPQQQFFTQYLDQYKQTNWIQRLLKGDPSAQIIFGLPFSDDNGLPEDIKEIEYTIIQDPDTRLMWDNKKTQAITRNFNELDEKWQVNKKGIFNFQTFDWDQVYSMTYNNSHTKLAFATPGKIAITPAPLKSLPKSSIINLKSISSKAICTHLAFSCDSNALTCIINNKIYRINLLNNKITELYVPQNMSLFSSILIADNVLLMRASNGNSYQYNILTKDLKKIPNARIDYYVVCHPLKDKILLLGLSKQSDGSIRMISEDLEIGNKDEHA